MQRPPGMGDPRGGHRPSLGAPGPFGVALRRQHGLFLYEATNAIGLYQHIWKLRYS